MRSKFTTLLLLLGLVVSAGTAGVLASSDGGSSKSADAAQYVPGKGCGDPVNTHTGVPGTPACPRRPNSETASEARARRRARCARKFPNNRKRRSVCFKRATAVANCKKRFPNKGTKRTNCIADAKKIGQSRS
jgi:hypothetical protein